MRRSKFFSIFVYTFLFVVIIATYVNFFVLRNFLVTASVSCDPSTESCFVMRCDTESLEDCDTTPYKYVKKKASNIPICNPYKNDCPESTCAPNESGCVITYCSVELENEDEICARDVSNVTE